MGQRRKHIKKSDYFPKINKKNHTVHSDQDGLYNCIAFAAGVITKKWWPIVHPDAFWPHGAPYTESVDSFTKAFATIGYASCANGDYEDGIEKIVFYTSDGRVKHAARQIGQDKWASKLGNGEDIQHKLSAVAGGGYGSPTVFLSRAKAV